MPAIGPDMSIADGGLAVLDMSAVTRTSTGRTNGTAGADGSAGLAGPARRIASARLGAARASQVRKLLGGPVSGDVSRPARCATGPANRLTAIERLG
jgi:hypothetical protein